jgi:hypothetical protein
MNPGGSNLDPLGPIGPPRPPRYFRLPMVNLGTPPLPPNRPYHWPFNYLEYVKDSNLDAHVKVFKVAIKANNETNDAKIINLFNFTFKNTVSN